MRSIIHPAVDDLGMLFTRCPLNRPTTLLSTSTDHYRDKYPSDHSSIQFFISKDSLASPKVIKIINIDLLVKSRPSVYAHSHYGVYDYLLNSTRIFKNRQAITNFHLVG